MAKKKILKEVDVDYLEKRLKLAFVTKGEFEDFKEDLDSTLSKHRSDLMEKLDSILKEILASREEQTILAHRSSNHEGRITKIERKVGIQTS